MQDRQVAQSVMVLDHREPARVSARAEGAAREAVARAIRGIRRRFVPIRLLSPLPFSLSSTAIRTSLAGLAGLPFAAFVQISTHRLYGTLYDSAKPAGICDDARSPDCPATMAATRGGSRPPGGTEPARTVRSRNP